MTISRAGVTIMGLLLFLAAVTTISFQITLRKLVLTLLVCLGVIGILAKSWKTLNARFHESSLTRRETEALKFIAEGLTNGQIAIEMKVSVKTVEKHRQSLMNKAGLHDTAALTRYAVSRGILLLHRYPGTWTATRVITNRESQVLKLIADGLVNKQIASELNISLKTVGNHRQALMNRLDIHETAGLTRYAIAEGLIPSSTCLPAVQTQELRVAS